MRRKSRSHFELLCGGTVKTRTVGHFVVFVDLSTSGSNKESTATEAWTNHEDKYCLWSRGLRYAPL